MQRLALGWQRQGIRIGFVPTMGFLHAGHMSLVQRARKLVGPEGKVVVSVYVNPTQFGPKEDLSRYPRDLRHDQELCEAEGVDLVFAPTDEEMYPPSNATPFSTYVVEEHLSRSMEGVTRPTHFRGVTTVVAKLFLIVQPTLAVFGAKDFQQATIIKQMVRDLNFPVKIVVAPIFREADGLAMSSRNKYLTGDLRIQAVVLSRAIEQARTLVSGSAKPVAVARLKSQLKRFIEKEPAAQVDYVEFFNPETLAPVSEVSAGTQMALAVYVGKTRLIDNAQL